MYRFLWKADNEEMEVCVVGFLCGLIDLVKDIFMIS